MHKSDDQISESITNSLFQVMQSSSPAGSLRQQIYDQGLIHRIDPSLYEAIPGLGFLVGAIRSGLNVNAWFLEQKILRFIEGLQETPIEERQAFISEIQKDSASGQDVARALIVLLDRFDHLDKAYFLAKILGARVRDDIDESTFWRLSSCVDKAYIEDLKMLLKTYSEMYARVSPWERLHACGLADLKLDVRKGNEIGLIEEVKVEYTANRDARILAWSILEDSFVPWVSTQNKQHMIKH